MTFEEIATMIEKIGLPSAYDHFIEGESPKPPFIVFLLPGTDNFVADDRVYQMITDVRIELYTEKKQPNVEQRIETILDTYGIPWDKDEEWIPDEKLYEVYYDFAVDYEYEEETEESTDDADDNNG